MTKLDWRSMMRHASVSTPISRVTIIGGGFAGVTAAALLQRLGKSCLEVRVLEQQSRTAWSAKHSFPVGLWAPACSVLERLGVNVTPPACQPVPGGSYTNRHGDVLAQPSAEALAESHSGVLRFFQSAACLLDEIAASQHVHIEYEKQVTGLVYDRSHGGRAPAGPHLAIRHHGQAFLLDTELVLVASGSNLVTDTVDASVGICFANSDCITQNLSTLQGSGGTLFTVEFHMPL